MVGEEEIGEIDPWHLIREAYPHAIYLHGGRPYCVTDIFKSNREIRLVHEHSRNLTDPHINKALYTRRVRAVSKYPHLIIKMADFEVTERLVAILEKNRNGDTIKQFTGSQGLAPHRLPTEGISIEVQPQLSSRIETEIRASNRSSVLHAIERLIRGLFPIISGPCDIMDFNTFSEARSGMITWYLYDQVRDGIDLTIRAYLRVAELLAKALDRVISCKCDNDNGCFRCIRNPEEEEVSSKTDCIQVLKILCKELSFDHSDEVFDIDVLEEDKVYEKCAQCGSNVRYDDKFCSNCGERLGM
jgi:DEAD/DEAH box helicase domain-containing protein